ncbi:MAG: hypothetical protein ACK5B9_09535 [Flavobacteriia bacterium]|jgi:hypothetical protein
MKGIISFICLLSFSVFFAQSPQKMSFQAVVRNAQNQLVQNSNVGIKISILEASASGTSVYAETHLPITNENGIFTIEIGNGTLLSGNFSQITWSTNSYWLKTEVDPLGGNNYTISTVSQFLSVPYALHSSFAENSGNEIQNIIDNGNGTLTFEYLNGSSFTTAPLTSFQGQNGSDGLSAYQIWLNQGNTGTENDFLLSMKGEVGAAGSNGTNGSNGLPGNDGQNGVSIVNSYIQNDSLKLNLSNGQTLNAGLLAGVSITNTVIQNDSLIVSLSNGQEINAGYLNCPGQNIDLPTVISIGTEVVSEPIYGGTKFTFMVTGNGNELILSKGAFYSKTNPNPSFNDNCFPVGLSQLINDTSSLSLFYLEPNTQYYIRSYATNSKGTSFGEVLSFTSMPNCLLGNYNCTIDLHFNNDDNSVDYSNTYNAVMTVNNDYSFTLSINDPNLPFECTTLDFQGHLSCSDSFNLNMNNGNCHVEFMGELMQDNHLMNADYSYSTMSDSNGTYYASIVITIN